MKLTERFAEIDKSVYRSEQRIDLLSDDAEQLLKQERLALKDEISAFLQSN